MPRMSDANTCTNREFHSAVRGVGAATEGAEISTVDMARGSLSAVASDLLLFTKQ
jgi:hypothetical protein